MFSKKTADNLERNAAIARAVASGEKMGRSWRKKIFPANRFNGPFGGPSSSQVKSMLDKAGIPYI